MSEKKEKSTQPLNCPGKEENWNFSLNKAVKMSPGETRVILAKEKKMSEEKKQNEPPPPPPHSTPPLPLHGIEERETTATFCGAGELSPGPKPLKK